MNNYLKGIDNADKTPNWKNRARLIVEPAKQAGLTLEEIESEIDKLGVEQDSEILKYVREYWNSYEMPV